MRGQIGQLTWLLGFHMLLLLLSFFLVFFLVPAPALSELHIAARRAEIGKCSIAHRILLATSHTSGQGLRPARSVQRVAYK